jgi:hypothetical protein
MKEVGDWILPTLMGLAGEAEAGEVGRSAVPQKNEDIEACMELAQGLL